MRACSPTRGSRRAARRSWCRSTCRGRSRASPSARAPRGSKARAAGHSCRAPRASKAALSASASRSRPSARGSRRSNSRKWKPPMPATPAAVKRITLEDMQDARRRIAGKGVRTPLIRLRLAPQSPDILRKLENRHATLGLEILEDVPDAAAVIAAIGGGGLITGVGSALKALRSGIKVWGAEPETAAPAALSFSMGSPQVFRDWRPSFVDGAGGKSLFPRMWERMRPVVDGSIVVSLEQTRAAMRLIAEKARVIAEGAGALSLAAALTGRVGQGPIVAIVSGGNVDLAKFCELIASPAPRSDSAEATG